MLVGAEGVEPPTCSLKVSYSTGLSYTPRGALSDPLRFRIILPLSSDILFVTPPLAGEVIDNAVEPDSPAFVAPHAPPMLPAPTSVNIRWCQRDDSNVRCFPQWVVALQATAFAATLHWQDRATR